MCIFFFLIINKGESVVWRFAVQELDIDFSVDLHPDIDGQYLEALETEDASVNMDTNVREKACEKFQVPAGGSNVGIFPVHNTTRYRLVVVVVVAHLLFIYSSSAENQMVWW